MLGAKRARILYKKLLLRQNMQPNFERRDQICKSHWLDLNCALSLFANDSIESRRLAQPPGLLQKRLHSIRYGQSSAFTKGAVTKLVLQ